MLAKYEHQAKKGIPPNENRFGNSCTSPKFSGAAKASPVAGGSAETSYLTILYGIILPNFRPSPNIRGRLNKGIITFYIDPRGNLVHQAVRQSSGVGELDKLALAAIKRSGPFPPPPTALPVGIRWEY